LQYLLQELTRGFLVRTGLETVIEFIHSFIQTEAYGFISDQLVVTLDLEQTPRESEHGVI
jgi:hypothetical protein